MGSVSMQSQVGSRSEHLSAVVDGEWAGGPGHIGEFLAELSGAERAAWSEYHLIGDALRSDDLAVHPVASSNFLRGFAARLEAEPHVLAPAAAGARARASALRAVKRRLIPGLAVAAAAATLSWIVLPQLQRADAPHAAVQMAAQPARHDAALQVAAAGGPAGSDGNIIRDAGLDQYLEAHQQFAQQPMVPGSAPFIRAAAMTTQGQ
jgi:sigma-E factor negative regulatory protein RseA